MRNNKVAKIAFCGLVSGLGVMLMFLTGIVPIATLAIPAIAGCLLIAVVAEAGIKWAIVAYAATAVLSFLVVADREAALFYVLFFGYYPVVFALLGRIKNKALRYAVKIIIFNAAAILEFLISVNILGIPFETIEFLGKYTAIVLLALTNIVFIVYDLAIDRLIGEYYRRFRSKVKNVFKGI